MNALFRGVFYWGYKCARVYWFLVRPKALGTKCIVVCEDEVLLIRNSYGPLGWTFPGGGVHAGESFVLAAARELGEEVGIEVRPEDLEFIGTFLLTKEYKKDTVHVFSLLVVDKPEVVVDNREVVEARWFKVADLPALTPSGAYAWKLYSHAN